MAIISEVFLLGISKRGAKELYAAGERQCRIARSIGEFSLSRLAGDGRRQSGDTQKAGAQILKSMLAEIRAGIRNTEAERNALQYQYFGYQQTFETMIWDAVFTDLTVFQADWVQMAENWITAYYNWQAGGFLDNEGHPASPAKQRKAKNTAEKVKMLLEENEKSHRQKVIIRTAKELIENTVRNYRTYKAGYCGMKRGERQISAHIAACNVIDMEVAEMRLRCIDVKMPVIECALSIKRKKNEAEKLLENYQAIYTLEPVRYDRINWEKIEEIMKFLYNIYGLCDESKDVEKALNVDAGIDFNAK